MPLFTDPIVLNDGAADHTLTFRAQLADKKSIVGEWVEPAATLASESKLIVKHDSTSPVVKRRLLQRNVKVAIPDLSLRAITVNLTITHHPEHTSADIQKQVLLLKDAMSEPTFIQNFLMGLI